MISRYIKSDFLKNVATLSIGTALAQVLPIIASPILTRLYSPQAFGDLTLLMSLAGLVSVIATLRYEVAIVLPQKDADAVDLARLSLKIALYFTVATAIIVAVWMLVDRAHGKGTFNPVYWLAPLSVLLAAGYQVQFNWLSRKKKYKNMSIGRFLQSVSNVAFSIGAGFINMGAWGLCIALVLGQSVALIYGAKVTGNILYDKILSTPFKVFKQLAKRYEKFPKYNSPHAFIDSVTNNGINFFIDYLLGGVITGFYGFSFRILRAPSALVSSAIYQVFYQRAVDLHIKKESIRPSLVQLYTRLFLIGVVPFGLLMALGPQLFAFAFGQEWRKAGEITAIVSPWILLNFTVSPAACLTAVKEKQAHALVYILIDVLLKFGAFYFGFVFIHHPYGAFIAFTVVASIMQLWWMAWFYRIAGANQ